MSTALVIVEEKTISYIKSQVDSSITPIRLKLSEDLAKYEKEIEYLKKALNDSKLEYDELMKTVNLSKNKINNLIEVYTLADEAEMGLRSAYITLQKLKQDKSFQKIVSWRLNKIFIVLSKYYRQVPTNYEGMIYVDENGRETNVEDFSLDEMVRHMHNGLMPHSDRRDYMVYVIKKPHREIYKEALEVFKKSQSMYVCAAFCGVLSEVSEKKADFLDFDGWIEICEEELNR